MESGDLEVCVKVEVDDVPSGPAKVEPDWDELNKYMCKPEYDYIPNLKTEVHIDEAELHIKDEADYVAEDSLGDEKSKGKRRKDRLERSYHCYGCSYQTKNKKLLKSHVMIHRDASKVVMFTCQTCGFESRYRSSWERHMMLKHTEDAAKYKCDRCYFQSKKRDSVTRHIRQCHSSARVNRFQCPHCTYKTCYRSRFERHKVVHMDNSDVEMFSCQSCGFQTKHKFSWDNHVLRHAEDAPMYKCARCNYQTKHKATLRRHILTHSKEKKCENCDYWYRYQSQLLRHRLRCSVENQPHLVK